MAAVPLYLYQKKWFLNRSRFKCGMFARQAGKTFTSTLEIVDSCHLAEAQGKRERWVILSRGERQAKEAMEEGIKLHCKAYNMAIEFIEGEFIGEPDAEGKRNVYKMLEVVLPGGSRITALPANPDTARGFSANVMLDEFDIHQDSRKIWAALFPVITSGNKRLIVISTPKHKGGKFYDIITGKDDVWYRQIVDIHQAVADGLPRDVQLLESALNDADVWKQEFELDWLDGATAWLTYDLINGAEHPDAGYPELYQGGDTVIGNDIAIRNDLWVCWVKEVIGDVLWTREISILHRTKFAEHDAEMDRLFYKYNPYRIAMDQTGMGEKPVEDAKGRYGEHRVEGVLFTSGSKQLLATVGKESFEDRRERIPQGNQPLREDLHSLKRTATLNNNVRFDADRTGGSHGDRVWSGFLATYAATSPIEMFSYESVNANYNDKVIRAVKASRGLGASNRGLL